MIHQTSETGYTREIFEEAKNDPQGYDEVGRAYYNAPHLDLKGKHSGEEGHEDGEVRNPATKETANLISSLCQDGLHRPVLDFDIPARYVPSTTPGHGHLYIDKGISWEDYKKVLNVLQEVGIIEPGYANAAIRRGASFVRPEWVRKPTKEPVNEPAVVTQSPPAQPFPGLGQLIEEALEAEAKKL